MHFIPADGSEPFVEVHHQRAYPIADVCNMLLEAGFSDIQTKDGYSNEPIHPHSQRVVFVVR